MTKPSFLFLQDKNSEWYATMGHDEASKTPRGEIDDTVTNYENLEECTRKQDERAPQSGQFIPITASGRQL